MSYPPSNNKSLTNWSPAMKTLPEPYLKAAATAASLGSAVPSSSVRARAHISKSTSIDSWSPKEFAREKLNISIKLMV